MTGAEQSPGWWTVSVYLHVIIVIKPAFSSTPLMSKCLYLSRGRDGPPQSRTFNSIKSKQKEKSGRAFDVHRVSRLCSCRASHGRGFTRSASPFSASSSSPAFILGAPAELSAAGAGLRVRRHVFTRKFQEPHQ